MTQLTPTQAKGLAFIQSSIERAGMAPSLREICAHMGYSAIGSAQDLVSALRKKGFLLASGRQTARSFVPSSLARQQPVALHDTDPNTFVIPCLGTVPAGNPVEALENHIGTLRMSIGLLAKPQPKPAELFALQATGDSMIGAGILDGDWLVIKLEQEPPAESIVVARVEGDVTVKRLLRHAVKGWYLQPENPRFKPLYARDTPFEIVGRVIALQRALS